MAAFKFDNLAERQAAATKAKQALLDRFKAQPKADDPAVMARVAAQKAVAEARDARRAERDEIKRIEAARLAAEAAERAAEAARQAAAERLAAKDRAEAEAQAVLAAKLEAAAKEERAALLDEDKRRRALAVAAEQKALRDARYAARKARK